MLLEGLVFLHLGPPLRPEPHLSKVPWTAYYLASWSSLSQKELTLVWRTWSCSTQALGRGF